MSDLDRALLEQFVDGSLPSEREADVAALLGRDPAASRFVAEHRFVWEALKEADEHGVQLVSPAFREQLLALPELKSGAQRSGLLRYASLAAAVVIAVTLYSAWGPGTSRLPPVDAADREVVRHLHVLQRVDLLESQSQDLDFCSQYEVYRAFDGELEEDEG
jgi:anti-sigma factor RsiW